MQFSDEIKQLLAGRTVTFRAYGNSMEPLLKSGQTVTLVPITGEVELHVGNIVLCKVAGHYYLHKITKIIGGNYEIGNNKGRLNGWTRRQHIFGLLQ